MRSRAEAGASVPRTGEPRPGGAGAAPTFPGERGSQGGGAGPRMAGMPRAPGDTNRHLRPGECTHTPRLSSLKGCSTHSWTREQLGEARAAAPW